MIIIHCWLLVADGYSLFVTPPLGKERLCDQEGETEILHLLQMMNWKKSGGSIDR